MTNDESRLLAWSPSRIYARNQDFWAFLAFLALTVFRPLLLGSAPCTSIVRTMGRAWTTFRVPGSEYRVPNGFGCSASNLAKPHTQSWRLELHGEVKPNV